MVGVERCPMDYLLSSLMCSRNRYGRFMQTSVGEIEPTHSFECLWHYRRFGRLMLFCIGYLQLRIFPILQGYASLFGERCLVSMPRSVCRPSLNHRKPWLKQR